MKLPFPLQESEKVLLVCRRHWLFLYPGLALRFVAALVPVLALVLLLRAAGAFDGIGLKIALVISAVWLSFWAVNIFLFKYRYDNDLWTITDQRIVDSVRSNPLALKMLAADLISEIVPISTSPFSLHQSRSLRLLRDACVLFDAKLR